MKNETFSNSDRLSLAIDKLGADFPSLNWDFRPDPSSGKNELVSQWLGEKNENVMACVFKGKHINEKFHRQDFFFLNFAYRGNYNALSARFDNKITVEEGDCYVGQPYSGYALKAESKTDIIIAGILIRKEVFFQEYLTSIASDENLYKFFLVPERDKFSDEFIKIHLEPTSPIWNLLNLMMIEYAFKTEDTQQILKPLALSLVMYFAREYKAQNPSKAESLAQQIAEYIALHSDKITLEKLSRHFGYHPAYISALLPRETGKKFSEILTETRMRKAKMLLENTNLTIEKISEMLGFSATSNFYKAFKKYFGKTPKQITIDN